MRTTIYTPQIGQELAALYAAGHTFEDIAEFMAWAPAAATVRKWRREQPDFAKMLADVEADRADALADQTLAIADNTFDPTLANARIKARQWLASKLNRAKYGEKVEVAHTHTLDLGKLLAEAEARLVTSAAPIPTTPAIIDVTPNNVSTLADLLA